MWAKRLYLILFVALAGIQAMGQARLGVTIEYFPTSGFFGDTATHSGSVFIHNYGTAAFADSLNLEYEVDSTINLSNNNGVGIYFSNLINLNPGDSVAAPLTVNFTPSIFRDIGTSGVVIWPRCLDTVTLLPPDTTTFFVTLTWPEGIAPRIGDKLLVYMDGQQLNIKTNAGNLLSRVRIYDVSGKLIKEQPVTSSAIIEMSNCASGMYIAEVIFTDESRKDYKIINAGNH